VSDKTGAVADNLEPATPEIRASDQDRERTVEQLRRHAIDGTLTLDEFTDRVGVALAARTRAELDAVLSDLPAAAAPEARRVRVRRWVVAFMSGSKAKGRWRVGESVTAVAVMGGCELDFRRAEINAPEVRVTAVAIMGGIDIIVPVGISVELTGLPIMGGKHIKIADVPFLPGSPLISVRAFPIMGGVNVRSKPESRKTGPADLERRPSQDLPVELSEVEEIVASRGEGEATGAPEGTVTIMFSDIAGYSEITDRLGDLAAHDLIRTHNAIVREQVHTQGGHEVKSHGDGFMVAFSSATRGLRCAVAIQKAFEKYCLEHPQEPIHVHLGLHAGEPVRDEDDLLGRTVIIASRLSDLASPGEILVSSLLHDLAESAGEFRFGEPRNVELKGISSAQTIYPVDWQG